MFTIFYKGFYINGYSDKEECSIACNGIDTKDRIGYTFKSVRAAKMAISKWLNKGLTVEQRRNFKV